MIILVVEDEKSICELITEILIDAHEILQAHNGKQAWQLIQRRKPDLVISDIMMPEMTGMELLAAIRADAKFADLPVIMLSAAIVRFNTKLQPTIFLPKPFDIEVLESEVAKIEKSLAAKSSPGQITPIRFPTTEIAPSYNQNQSQNS